MEFEWDETKRAQILALRGFDILFAARIFSGTVLTKLDLRRNYGEQRYVAMGAVDGEVFVVVHTIRDERIRLITAWKGGRREQEIYAARIASGHRGDA